MSAGWHVRLLAAADLPSLGALLPAADLEAAALSDANSDDQLLLAVPLDARGKPGVPRGCIRIRRNIGLDTPRYWYHLGCVVHAAPELGLFHRQRTLLLGNDHTGATELADIAIDREALDSGQQAALWQLLVRAALHLLQREQQQKTEHATAENKIIAALPGLRTAQNLSPFWQGLGRHFYPGDVANALTRFGSQWFTHVAALLPRHPVVVSLLDAAAQAAIGGVSEHARGLQAAVERAGLRAGQHVTLFDAGPVYEAHLALLPSAQQIRRVSLRSGQAIDSAQDYLIANESGAELWQLPAQVGANGAIALAALIADALGLTDGELVWIAPLS